VSNSPPIRTPLGLSPGQGGLPPREPTASLLSIGATKTLETVLAGRIRTLFTVAELQDELLATNLHLAVDDLTAELERRVGGGELHRITPELYWCGAPSPFGPAAPHSSVVVEKIYGTNTGWGYAYVSAVNGLHLTTQVPNSTWYAVPYEAGLELPFSTFVIRSQLIARAAAGLTVTEVTLLEALGATSRWNDGPESSFAHLAARIASGRLPIDRDRLLAGAVTEDPSTIEALEEMLALCY
jgi:hypothetical protein